MQAAVPMAEAAGMAAEVAVTDAAADGAVVVREPPAPIRTTRRGWAPRDWSKMLAALAVGGLAGYYGMRVGSSFLARGAGPLGLGAGLATLPLVWLLVVGVHELGHLTGGWMMGGRFLLWAVGPIMVRRTPAGIRPAWNRSVNLLGGMAACLPLEPGRLTPRRMAVMIAGGPVFSLLLAVLAAGLAVGLAAQPGPLPRPVIVAQHAAVYTAGLSLLVFLVTVAPQTTGGLKSDGRRVFELLQPGPRSDQESALLALTAAGLAGVRPADYPAELVAKTAALGDGSLFDLYGRGIVYMHAADRGDWRAAQEHLDYVLRGEADLVPHVRDAMRCEYAWLLATRTGAAAAARAWLDSAGKLDFDPATRLRAEAAVLLAEGRHAEAAARARDGMHALERRSLSPVRSAFAAEALEDLLRRAGSAPTAPGRTAIQVRS